MVATYDTKLSKNKALDKQYNETELVLFTICLQNYNSNGFKGFRLNRLEYSPYPEERRIVLLDGVEVVVLKIEEFGAEGASKELQ